MVLDKKCGVVYHETTTKIRFLLRELRIQSEMMEKATSIIELAIEKYHQYIDNDIQKYNEELNVIMRRFTFIAISFLPQTVTAGFFGMNVSIPFMYTSEPSLVPFMVIVLSTFGLTLVSALIFRKLNYI